MHGKDINKYKESILEDYRNGVGLVKLSKKYHLAYYKIKDFLIQINELKPMGYHKRKYTVNENFFDEINTPEAAYILGLFAADGCVYPERNVVTINLQESDYELLKKVKDALNYTGEIRFVPARPSMKQNQYNLTIINKHIVESLINVGLHPRKSLTLTFPASVPERLYSHFIRGYFDGDGCFYLPQKRYKMLVNLASTEAFCNKVLEIIKNNIEIQHDVFIVNTQRPDTSTRVLKVHGIKNVKRFLDWIYQDATIYLQRKYDKYYNCFYQTQSELSLAN